MIQDELEASSMIRAAQDRRLSGEVELLWVHMAKQQLVGTVTVDLITQPQKIPVSV